jgi:hypothetical protein
MDSDRKQGTVSLLGFGGRNIPVMTDEIETEAVKANAQGSPLPH